MASLRHPNVLSFLGICTYPPCLISEFCPRGSLDELLREARTSLAAAAGLSWKRRLHMVGAAFWWGSKWCRMLMLMGGCHARFVKAPPHQSRNCQLRYRIASTCGLGRLQAAGAACGMLYLHSRDPPVMHRDLKSPNLLVSKHWNVKVRDAFAFSCTVPAHSLKVMHLSLYYSVILVGWMAAWPRGTMPLNSA